MNITKIEKKLSQLKADLALLVLAQTGLAIMTDHETVVDTLWLKDSNETVMEAILDVLDERFPMDDLTIEMKTEAIVKYLNKVINELKLTQN